MTLDDSVHEILQRPRERLGDIFYEVFAEYCPDVQEYFGGVNLRVQATMLMNALQIVAAHSKQSRAATTDYLKILGHRHHLRGIPSSLYPAFCEAMLVALARFHGNSWNSQLADDWRSALEAGTQTMIAGHVPGSLSY